MIEQDPTIKFCPLKKKKSLIMRNNSPNLGAYGLLYYFSSLGSTFTLPNLLQQSSWTKNSICKLLACQVNETKRAEQIKSYKKMAP